MSFRGERGFGHVSGWRDLFTRISPSGSFSSEVDRWGWIYAPSSHVEQCARDLKWLKRNPP
jgi:hypothetical protein